MSSPTKDYAIVHDAEKGTPEYDTGNGLLSTLKLPAGNGLTPSSEFAWQVNKPRTTDLTGAKLTGGKIQGPFVPGSDPNKANLTTMTMAGAMALLRDLALHHNTKAEGNQYDAIVYQLMTAGYLDPTKAKYGAYTTDVANAFLRSAADVWSINSQATGDDGQLYTWADHIKALTDARIASGQIDPKTGLPGSSSSGSATPTRTDSYTNPEDVRSAADTAAKNLLGRKLTDKEFNGLYSAFHGKEKSYNDQVWAQQEANANGDSSSPDATRPPSPSSDAENYVDTAPGMSQERTTQLLGSYLGVLRGMTGLGSGGVANAVS